jgi:hypothetical protein
MNKCGKISGYQPCQCSVKNRLGDLRHQGRPCVIDARYYTYTCIGSYQRRYVVHHKPEKGRAIAHTVSRWLLTAAARIRARVTWGGKKWRWDRFSPSA